MSDEANIEVRPLQEPDLEVVVQIARTVTGEENDGFWRGLLRAYLMGEGNLSEGLSPALCKVAVQGGEPLAFMIGDVQSWQFGVPRCGRILAVGVDPQHRRSGLARALAEEFFDQFRRLRVPFVQCQVQPGDLLGDFFHGVGFVKSDWITLTREL